VFQDLGIKGRVLLLTLLPTSLLALVLGGYFIWTQLADLQAQLLQRGQMIAEQLAPLVAPPLEENDAARLRRIAESTLDKDDVRSVSFLNAAREPLAHAGPRMLGPGPEPLETGLALSSSADTTHMLLPVVGGSERVDTGDARLLGWVELELSHQPTLLRGYRRLFTSLLLIGGGLLITALLAARLGRTISQPLRRIGEGVAQLRDGQLQTRLPHFRSQELTELAKGINGMAEALQRAQEELQHSIDQATEDVRQNLETIEIQNIELDLARKEALAASRIKSEFLANMSHEIRTPLNGILGFTQLLQKSDLSLRQRDYLETIEKSASSLLDIINEILDFSKIEAGKLVLDSIPFNLRDVVEESLTLLAPTAHAKGLELVSLVYRDTPLSLVGDPARLRQVFTNLIGNAIKFTAEGSIVVRVMVEDESNERAQLRISVQDTGGGLSEAEQTSLFQAFSQADNSISRQVGGTGLGLAISKRLIEQMGGEIGVQSELGEGAEFWIGLRLPKAHATPEELLTTPFGGRRALVFERHELARQALLHGLEDCGLNCQVCSSPQTLIEQVRQAGGDVSLAVLGVQPQSETPLALREWLAQLDALGCQSLLLCPTSELARYLEIIPERSAALLAKPAQLRKLQRALQSLDNPQAVTSNNAPLRFRDPLPRVLCVDDNPANLRLVETLLQEMGAQVVAVDNGSAALQASAEQRFDLILMDVQMPGLDGRQTTEAIRRREAAEGHVPVPIVAVTAHALAGERRELLHCGMNDYLGKPISEGQLEQIVLKWTSASSGDAPIDPTSSSAPRSQAVLDLDEGLSLAAGRPELAREMLDMLIAGLTADRLALRQAREADDAQALLERVHRLHGATRYCGVPQLRTACELCETLLKQGEPSAEAALVVLDQAIERLQLATASSETS